MYAVIHTLPAHDSVFLVRARTIPKEGEPYDPFCRLFEHRERRSAGLGHVLFGSMRGKSYVGVLRISRTLLMEHVLEEACCDWAVLQEYYDGLAYGTPSPPPVLRAPSQASAVPIRCELFYRLLADSIVGDMPRSHLESSYVRYKEVECDSFDSLLPHPSESPYVCPVAHKEVYHLIQGILDATGFITGSDQPIESMYVVYCHDFSAPKEDAVTNTERKMTEKSTLTSEMKSAHNSAAKRALAAKARRTSVRFLKEKLRDAGVDAATVDHPLMDTALAVGVPLLTLALTDLMGEHLESRIDTEKLKGASKLMLESGVQAAYEDHTPELEQLIEFVVSMSKMITHGEEPSALPSPAPQIEAAAPTSDTPQRATPSVKIRFDSEGE